MPNNSTAPGRSIRLARLVHRRVVYPLLAFLLPSVCFACRRALGVHQRLGACIGCWTALRVLPPPICPRCALPRPSGTDLLGPAGGRCGSCVVIPRFADLVHAVVAYDDTARSFLLRAKLGRRPELLSPLGRQLARALEVADLARGCTALTVVPSHPVATFRRGFSPARELARPVARLLGLPLRGALIRRRLRAGGPVKRLSARSRRLALRDAFVVRDRLPGCRVLLIDDVMTTGETVAACTRALKGAGALEVRVAVWARTLPPHWGGPPSDV